MKTVDYIIAYENGELSSKQVVNFFSKLVKSGMAWQLQGSYGRMARNLIDNGYITAEGRILKNV